MLFLNAGLAARAAPAVSAILQEEIGTDGQLASFLDLARQYAQVPA